MACHKPKAKSYKSNSSNNDCGSQVSIEIRETPVNQKPAQSPTSKDEQDQVDTPNFTVSLERLAEVVETNVLGSKDQSSGVQQIASALETNIDSGIIGDEKDLYCRIKAFGLNKDFEARMNMIDKISVIADASPADKILMVQCLRKKVEVVATTGSCIRDFPSLIEADVGIFVGGNSARMAKEDADIIAGLKICTIISILRMGRYVCQSIKRFLELHLTLNISAFMINLIFEISTSEGQLSSFQLLWTNLAVESMGAFALATLMVQMEPTNPQNGPNVGEGRNPPPALYGAGPIITKKMWRNIVVQSLFQVTILMVLGLKGRDIFHVDNDVQKIMIFNSYVLCQVFMMIGATEKIKKTNFLPGAFSVENFLFLSVVGIIVALQILLIEIMGVIAHWGKLDCKRWWICIAIAALSSLLGHAAKRVSDYVLPCK